MDLRWPDGKVKCPVCGSERVGYLAKSRVWKCYEGHPRPTFSLKTGTIFEDSPIPLEKWLAAVRIALDPEDLTSSWELHRQLGVTQKTAWFMLRRIRLAMLCKSYVDAVDAEGIERLLRVPKAELAARVEQAKADSPRLGDPKAPGRKTTKL